MTVSAAAAPEPTQQSIVAYDQVELVRHYADALVNAADGEGQAEAVLDELGSIETEVFKEYPKFKQLLASDQVSPIEKDRMLVEVFGERVSEPGPAVPAGLEPARPARAGHGRRPGGPADLGSPPQADTGARPRGRAA